MSAPEVKLARIGEAEIAYVDVPPAQPAGGDPATMLLIHGFASTHVVNWVGPSWTGTLTRAGYRVVAFDNRGHGGSTKFHDPAAYDTRLMAADAVGLLDHLGIDQAHVMGYSMGARISAYVALDHPGRVRALLLGGLGFHLVEGVGLPLGIADAMEARSADQISDPTQRMFRLFAEQNRSDLVALAACIRGSRQVLSPEEVARITAPTLVSVGTRDEIAGPAAALAALFPNARALDIPGRDHNLAVGDRVHKEGVVAFLAGLTP
ncbi:alpha/beta fold hydrolase [uncultured Enterovirga sp.]|uniref:alpha/beta fold hydrolase n=1 Tax=uncultured Enterovirga sp. TaxID=2026352 RepID=UPI0035C99F87